MADATKPPDRAANNGTANNGTAGQEPRAERVGEPAYRPRYAHIVGWGSYVPEKVITNHDLEQIVDTNDEWIRSRTGIAERHVAADPKETSVTLAVAAARKALEVADVPAGKIDLIVCATTTPEYAFPATACLI
ncbi:MAG: ketoacyl-ACP synthase III, partial [Caldilinea sp.]|nr:ketoacyl-ACP synthase III [Caldilinea sp.]